MNKYDYGIDKMMTLNTAKAGFAIGLLLQQASVFSCESFVLDNATQEYHASALSKDQMDHDLQVALSAIQDLTKMLRYSYRVLANAHDENVSKVLAIVDQEKSQLIEHQLRGLEGAMRVAFKESTDDFKEMAKKAYVVVAEARSAVTNLNSLIKQRTISPDVFDSSVDMTGLRTLAEHGTKVFHSGNFH
ncbi:TPA: hypothetical protein JDC18_003787 [Salmonella enterica subsp. houtenae]|nr:hypothetical protein [Salmonella enterica]HBC0148825.1 hypothetical protein [Salmonella enterica subsp. houtenae]